MNIRLLKIVYFSPTNTTKRIVDAIAQGIGPCTMEIVDITSPGGRKQQLHTTENDLLLLGVPVYFGRVQINAIEWLHTIKAHNTPTVCVVVYGNREYDDALIELKDTAIRAGCLPIACGAFIGEHSFSSTETPIATGRPDADDLDCAKSFGQKIKEKTRALSSINQIGTITVPGNYPYIDMADSKEKLSSVDLVTVRDSCLQCGVCAEHCPVGAIDSENSAIVDKKKCILCNACIKVCPEKARKVNNDVIRGIAVRLSQSCHTRKNPICFL